MTNVPSDQSVFALHWPTAQATSIQNVVFKMSDAPGTKHQGILSEGGSGGFMTDLTFYGGLNGLNIDNQYVQAYCIRINCANNSFIGNLPCEISLFITPLMPLITVLIGYEIHLLLLARLLNRFSSSLKS
jgi:hypothetical protein